MHRLVGALFVAAILVTSARASDPTGLGGDPTEPGARRVAPSPPSEAPSASPMREHQMAGTVKDIDTDKGTITFESTDGKKMHLYFPRTALENVHEGDHVTIQLAIRPAPSGAMSGTHGSPHDIGNGTIPCRRRGDWVDQLASLALVPRPQRGRRRWAALVAVSERRTRGNPLPARVSAWSAPPHDLR